MTSCIVSNVLQEIPFSLKEDIFIYFLRFYKNKYPVCLLKSNLQILKSLHLLRRKTNGYNHLTFSRISFHCSLCFYKKNYSLVVNCRKSKLSINNMKIIDIVLAAILLYILSTIIDCNFTLHLIDIVLFVVLYFTPSIND